MPRTCVLGFSCLADGELSGPEPLSASLKVTQLPVWRCCRWYRAGVGSWSLLQGLEAVASWGHPHDDWLRDPLVSWGLVRLYMPSGSASVLSI